MIMAMMIMMIMMVIMMMIVMVMMIMMTTIIPWLSGTNRPYNQHYMDLV